MKNATKLLSILIIFITISVQIKSVYAVTPLNTIGRILLDVENHGEAYYVYPEDMKKYFLNRPYDAFKMIEDLGLGISDKDLKKIPIGEFHFGDEKDSDNDGIGDKIEVSLGTNPIYGDTDHDGYNDYMEITNNYEPDSTSMIKFSYDPALINRLLGRIVLQVERNGEAWYIHPVTHLRYFMGDPVSAFQVMKRYSLGVSSKVLEDIPSPYFGLPEKNDGSFAGETNYSPISN